MRILEQSDHFKVLSQLMWQDQNNDNYLAYLRIIENLYKKYHSDFWQQWKKDVYDLNTANDFGLRIWSIKLDVPIFGTNTPDPLDFEAFGFDSDEALNFDNGSFATDSNEQYKLTTEQKRTILKLRFYQLQSDCNTVSTNKYLASLFGSGKMYVINNQDMTLSVISDGSIDSEVLRAIEELDLIPREATVNLLFAIDSSEMFGFDSDYDNFDNGIFGD